MPGFNTMKGLFKAKHPEKYDGDPTNIVYRSSYELKLMRYLDREPNVLKWSSEEQAIGYRSPIDDAFHRYFPDAIVKLRNRDGVVETVMIEVKPATQTKPPTPREKPHTKSYIREVFMWGVNEAKWTAAREYCRKRGWKFIIMTEKELGITNNHWGKVKQP